MIAALEFASCYAYSPHGAGALCERSRLLCRLLKQRDQRFLRASAARVREQVNESMPMAAFLSPLDVLVPVPGCEPRGNRRRYVATLLADAFLQQGLGSDSWSGLQRIHSVPKSSTASVCGRPSVALHYESFAITKAAPCAARSLVLIDDVVTKGRTLLAAAVHLQEAFPGATIRAFALLRTVSRASELVQLLEPCRGLISWRRGDARREP